jgi:ABC-type xylose transport system permease subunit
MFNLDGVVNWAQVASYLGIIAIGACVLMIAGEFDLSIGSMIGFAGMMIAIPTIYFHWPLWAAIVFAFAGSMALGWLNGYIVIKTRLPSFIVTLAFLFILRGLTLALSIMFANRTIVSGIGALAARRLAGQPCCSTATWHLGPVLLDGCAWLDRRTRRWRAAGQGHSQSHRLVAGLAPAPASSCRVPVSATGCSPSAAMPTRPRMWAYPCAR